MKIYTIHSPSHQKYFDLFIESIKGKHTVDSRVIEQTGNPNFGSGTIKKFLYLKLLYILEILYTETEPFIISDVDIYFFKDFNLEIGDNDFLAQYEKTVYGFKWICAGFMYLKPNKKNRDMFFWVLKNLHRFSDEQKAINAYLALHPIKMNYELLPKEFYQINYDNGNKVWNGEEIKISVDPILFHYHWTLGDDNRMKLLEMVKGQVK